MSAHASNCDTHTIQQFVTRKLRAIVVFAQQYPEHIMGKKQAINVSCVCVTHAILRKWTGTRCIVEEHSQTISNTGRTLQLS